MLDNLLRWGISIIISLSADSHTHLCTEQSQEDDKQYFELQYNIDVLLLEQSIVYSSIYTTGYKYDVTDYKTAGDAFHKVTQ